jgi:putative membrane protein
MPFDIAHSLATLPAFLAYFGTAVAMTIIFVFVYLWITPHDEMRLIRQNKEAASISFIGALLGFIIPLATATAQSVSWFDCLIWSVVALIVQALTFVVVRIFLPHISEEITNDERAPALFLAGISIGVGILNAASMTY